MDYEVKINQSGRGGTIHYAETGKELAFDWKFAFDGALVFVPSPPRWNNFALRNDFPPAQNRRGEILERVCGEIIRRKAAGAKYSIGDEYVSISFRRITAQSFSTAD